MKKIIRKSRRSQSGAALFIALVALVTMAVAGIALVRSMDTSTLLVGNLVYRQATVQAAELGIADAIKYIDEKAAGQVAGIGGSPKTVKDEAGKVIVFGSLQETDADGLPKMDWDDAHQLTGVALLDTNAYQVSYVIESMCVKSLGKGRTGNSGCYGERLNPSYRISVRTLGPRNAESFVQVIYRHYAK